VVGTLKINGIESTNPDDKIAAFVNGELRGVASLNYISQYDRYEFFLDIYSDATDNEEVKFKVWNAALGQIHDDVTPQLLFEKNTIQGSPGLPKEFNVTNTLIVSYPMNKGWNWISFNVNSSQLSSSNNLLSEVDAANGDIIKAFGSRYDQFGTSVGWIGEITKQGGFNAREGYKLKLAKADTFQVTGVAVQTDQVSIPLVPGWNWIGFPSQMNLDINDALGNVNFDNGDFIKGQNSFAIYDYYLGWIGSLKYLTPKKGYMLKSGSSHSLTYPNPELLHNTAAKNQASGESPWQVNEYEYSNSMSLMVELNICGSAIDESSDYLGVFVGEECRGYVLPSYINAKGNYLFFLTANSNTSGEKLSFKYFDASEKESYAVAESIVFENDGIVGSLASPQLLSVAENNRCRTTAVINSVESIVRVFPNPFTEELTIDLIAGYSDETIIYISDITGKVIRTLSVNNKQVAWDGLSDNGVEVSDGIYILSVQMNDKVYNTKLFKTRKQ